MPNKGNRHTAVTLNSCVKDFFEDLVETVGYSLQKISYMQHFSCNLRKFIV